MKKEQFTGSEASLYTLENKSGMRVVLTDIGASIVNIFLRDKNGEELDVVLGYDNAEQYFNNKTSQGATVGRFTNRIANASFEIKGEKFILDKNEGHNTLHGGFHKYFFRLWDAKMDEYENSVTFTLLSPDLDQGMPGSAKITAKYTLDDDNGLKIEYRAVSDKDTYFNLTNHSYFNLNGHKSGDILDHYLWLDCDKFTEINSECIPTGNILDVKGTPLDFTKEKRIGDEIGMTEYEQLRLSLGYDHNFIINNPTLERPFARARSDKSGISMEVYTDLPGVQFYSANNLGRDKVVKGGGRYYPRSGFCLETQYFPDTPNKPNFPSDMFPAGKEYSATTVYRFSTL